MSPPSGKILTGAPRASQLDWSEEAYENRTEVFSFIDSSRAEFGKGTSQFRSLGDLPEDSRRNEKNSSTTLTTPKLPSSETGVENTIIEAAMAQIIVPADMTLGSIDGNENNTFLSTRKSTKLKPDFMSNYLQESFMLYNNSFSQALSLTLSQDLEGTQESSQPYSTFAPTASTPIASSLPTIGLPSPIIDLKKLPNASYINRIAPQTITVNLIVVVVNIAPPRTINLKQTNRKMDLVEIIVADETRAGFQVSFWLPADRQHVPRVALEALKTKHLILLKNVALHVWNGNVFGQSLSKAWTKTETTAQILGTQVELAVRIPDNLVVSPEAIKLHRVFQYARNYLAPPSVPRRVHDEEGRSTSFDRLPPETQF